MASLVSRAMNVALKALKAKQLFEEADRTQHDFDAFMKVVNDGRNHVIMQPEPSDRLKKRYPYESINVDGNALHLSKISGGKRVVLSLHGGVYIVPTARNVWTWYEKLCKGAEYDMAMFDYPLAPEHTAPDVVAAAVNAYQRLLERYEPSDIVISGESAGGGLALAMSMHLRSLGLPQPSTLLLMYPFLDAAVANPEALQVQEVDISLTVGGLRACGKYYAGDLDLKDPLVSPKYGSVEGLPPIHIFHGSADVLYPDSRDFVRDAQTAGHDAHFYLYEDMQHLWVLFPMPESGQATRKAIDILRSS